MALTAIGGDISSQALNDNFSYLDSDKVGTASLPFINVKDYGAIGDGVADDTSAVQAAINSFGTAGGTILLPPGTYNISSTLVFPSDGRPIEFVGMGGRDDSVTTGLSGVRINWVGGNGTSMIKVSNNLAMRNMLIQNENSATGLTGLNMNNPSTSPVSNCQFKNVFVKGCDIGIDFMNTWYNTFISCFVSHCNVGLQLGDDCNNTNFYTCHVARNSTGIRASGIAAQILFSGCSVEVNSTVGLDLTSAYYNWSFVDCYYEANTQTAWIGGYNTVIENAFVNKETPPAGKACFEIRTPAPVKLDNIRFSSDIPTNQGFSYTATLGINRPELVIGKVYKAYYLADFLSANMGVYENGIIDTQNSDMVVIESDMQDASAQQLQYLVPPNQTSNIVLRKVVGMYLAVYETLTAAMTVRFGNSGGSYDQYVNQVMAAGTAPGFYKLTLLSNPIMHPEAYNYRFYNTSATAGKYKMVLVLAG